MSVSTAVMHRHSMPAAEIAIKLVERLHVRPSLFITLPLHYPSASPCNFSLVASSFSHVRSLHCPRNFFSPFQFFSLVASSFPHTEDVHCSRDYPEPLESLRFLLSTIQPFGDMSCDRRTHYCCHARCDIVMLKACMRDIVSRTWGGTLLDNRHRNDNADNYDAVDDRKQDCPR